MSRGCVPWFVTIVSPRDPPGRGVARERKRPPIVWEICAAGKSPVALVDNDGGGSHERPCVAHDSSVARPSTVWLPTSRTVITASSPLPRPHGRNTAQFL